MTFRKDRPLITDTPENTRMYRSVVVFTLIKGLGADTRLDLLAELQASTGYDFIQYQPLYPAEVVQKVIEFFVHKYYSDWPRSEALRALGRCSVAGWTSTQFGRVTLTSLPLRSPLEAVNFAPSVFDRNRLFGRRIVEAAGQNNWILSFFEEMLPADYIAGELEAAAQTLQLRDFSIIVGPVVDAHLTQLTVELIPEEPENADNEELLSDEQSIRRDK